MCEMMDTLSEEGYSCRICHEESYPLLSVCLCLGSLSYVHETCIKLWINYLSQNGRMKSNPICELCSSPISADIRVKPGKICYFLLFHHLFSLSLKDKLTFLVAIILLIGAVMISLKIAIILMTLLIFSDWNTSNIFEMGSDILLIIALKILYPMYFLKPSRKLLRKLRKIVSKSRQTVLEIKMNPKAILLDDEQ